MLLLAEGFEQRAIPQMLVIGPKIVATYIYRVLTKLGVHSRARAVSEAYKLGLVAASSARGPSTAG